MAVFHSSGGPLSPDDPTYIERETDRQSFTVLERSDFVHIIAPRQMGKTSLLYRLRDKLVQREWRVAYCDLSTIQSQDEKTWYNDLGSILFSQLGWLDTPSISNAVRLKLALINLLQKEGAPHSIALFFDEVESIRKLDFTDSLFSTLRGIHGQPIDFPILDRVTCAFSCRSDPNALVENPDISPFNVGERMRLHDLTQDETRKLTEHLAQHDPKISPDVYQRIFWWTAGHPYLTQQLCAELERQQPPLTVKQMDQTVFQVFFGLGEPDANISHINRSLEAAPALENTLARVLAGDHVSGSDEGVRELYFSGIIKHHPRHENLVVRNQIYQQAFAYLENKPVIPPELIITSQAATQQQIRETEASWTRFSKQIEAMKRDIALETDGQKKVILQERLAQLEQERTKIKKELERLEKELTIRGA